MADPVAEDTSAAPVLDELMLAMDVVDTLRHQEAVALKELEQDGRDEALRERLRRLYESQGLTVPDRILDEGIRALKESRFTYEPTPPGIGRTLAGLWIRRGAIGKALGVLALLLALWAGWSYWQAAERQRQAEAARIELTETLPRQVEQAAEAALAEASSDEARNLVARLRADAAAALARGDAGGARHAVAGLERVRAELVQAYDLRIVSRPGEPSGVYRIPDINEDARNYYLIVEAVTPDGQVLSMPVTSEEDGKTHTVTKWGIRVPKATYDAVAADKSDDGIIQNNVLGYKPRGTLEPVFRMKVSGGAITEW